MEYGPHCLLRLCSGYNGYQLLNDGWFFGVFYRLR